MNRFLAAVIILFLSCAVMAVTYGDEPTPADKPVAEACDDATCNTCRAPVRKMLVAPVRVLRPIARVVVRPIRGIVQRHNCRVERRQARRMARRCR